MSDKKDQDDLSSLTELSDHEEERKQDQDDLFSLTDSELSDHEEREQDAVCSAATQHLPAYRAKRQRGLGSEDEDDHVVQPSRRKKPRVPTSPAVRRSSRAGKLRQPKGKHRRDSESASNYSDQDIDVDSTDVDSDPDQEPCFQFTYKVPYRFADPEDFQDIVRRKAANFRLLKEIAHIPQCGASNAMREVFDMASAEDLARSKVQRTPLPFAEATRLYYEGKDTEDDWRQCPKAQSTNAPGTYLISVYRPSADEAEKIVLEDTSEDELEFGSVDSASDGAGECVQEDVLSVQDVDTRTSSAEKDKVKVDDDNEETDEDGATFFHELNEICKTLRDQDSPLSANEFARCKALLAAYAGKSRSGYSSDNQTVAIVVGSMQIGLARRDLDHFRGSVHGKGMLVYRDEHGIARNPWQMLVSSNCRNGDFGPIDPSVGFNNDVVRLVVGNTVFGTERHFNAWLAVMEAEDMVDFDTLSDVSDRPWLLSKLASRPHDHIGVAEYGLNVAHGMQASQPDSRQLPSIEEAAAQSRQFHTQRLATLLLGTYQVYVKSHDYRSNSATATASGSASFANGTVTFPGWTRSCMALIRLAPHPDKWEKWVVTATSTDAGPRLQSQTTAGSRSMEVMFGCAVRALVQYRKEPPSWLASLLQDNPGLDELISKLLRAPFTRDEVLALNTALLLAGKFVEPRVGQSSDKGTAGIPRLVGKSKVFDMQFNWRGWSRSCPAMILLGRDVASTEEPVDFPAWKLVATASDGGLPLQKEVLLSPKTMNVFIRGFRLVKRYHAENHPELEKIIADNPGLAEKIASLPVDDIPSKEALLCRALARFVAGTLRVTLRPNEAKGVMGSAFSFHDQDIRFGKWCPSRPVNVLLSPLGAFPARWKVVATALEDDDVQPRQAECGATSSPTSARCKKWVKRCTMLKEACGNPEPGLAAILDENPDLAEKIAKLPTE